MANNLDDFVGIYTVTHGSGNLADPSPSSPPLMAIGYKVYVGMGSRYLDMAPDGTRIGVAIVDDQGQRVLPDTANPIYAYLVDGTLNGSTSSIPGTNLNHQQLVYQISLMVIQLGADLRYRAVSIMTVLGDPENAGVWSAEDDG